MHLELKIRPQSKKGKLLEDWKTRGKSHVEFSLSKESEDHSAGPGKRHGQSRQEFRGEGTKKARY